MKATSKQRRFKKTYPVGELVKLAEISDPFILFQAWPIEEIRRACLNSMFSAYRVDEERARWAKECILDLLQQQDPMAIDVLRWLVKNDVYGRHFGLNFLLSCLVPRELLKEPEAAGYIPWNEASKILFATLTRRPESYPAISKQVRAFFYNVFNVINEEGALQGYTDGLWAVMERLLMIFITVGDSYEKENVKIGIDFLQKKVIKPHDDEKGFKKANHLALLKHALSFLG